MSSNSHALVEISPGEWNQLLELYADRKTDSSGYYVIETHIRWFGKVSDLAIKIYSLDGDWKDDGTFIMITSNSEILQKVYINTLNDNLERLTQALLCLAAKPENDYLLFGYNKRLVPAVNAYKLQFGDKKFETSSTIWYWANKDIVMKFPTEPPEGITLRRVKTEDASIINDIWPHRNEGTIAFVKCLIEHNVSIAACDAADGKLVAWCLRLPLGSLGLLQVLDSHKRLGLGSLMVRCLSKEICEMGGEALAPVVPENIASRKMFEKLGFQQIDKSYWTE